MSALLYGCSILSILFSVFCFLLPPGPALLAFALALLFSGAFFFVTARFCASPNRKRLGILRKLLEYLPFVLFAAFVIRRSGGDETGFANDLVSAILWVLVFIVDLVLQYRLSEKRVSRYVPSLEGPARAGQVKKTIVMHTLEWIDALVQAACLVLLINLFLFQLYAIPSESMVPEFMIGDRVVVVKTPSGPKFPLTEVGVPRMRGYDRGDIVVFNNPHYNDTKEARVRSFASQLVYMLTFTGVNINRDEFGAVKADPLVKRVTGVPGEKLMMVDGVLYSRRAENAEYSPVAKDATWAAWDIASLPRSELALVKNVPLTKDTFNLLESIESKRANLDLAEAEAEARDLSRRLRSIKPVPDTVNNPPELFTKSRLEIVSMFQSNDEIARILLTTNGGSAWFTEFMTGWADDRERDNLFDERSRNLDLMIKLAFGRLIVRDAELFAGNSTAERFASDPARRTILSEADAYRFYLSVHDQRNMGEFPKGADSFIPEDCFFMMGDNRFNSLDMRHSYEVRLSPVDARDPLSFAYRSNLDPQYVPINRILGTACFRFWPLSRAGVPD